MPRWTKDIIELPESWWMEAISNHLSWHFKVEAYVQRGLYRLITMMILLVKLCYNDHGSPRAW